MVLRRLCCARGMLILVALILLGGGLGMSAGSMYMMYEFATYARLVPWDTLNQLSLLAWGVCVLGGLGLTGALSRHKLATGAFCVCSGLMILPLLAGAGFILVYTGDVPMTTSASRDALTLQHHVDANINATYTLCCFNNVTDLTAANVLQTKTDADTAICAWLPDPACSSPDAYVINIQHWLYAQARPLIAAILFLLLPTTLAMCTSWCLLRQPRAPSRRTARVLAAAKPLTMASEPHVVLHCVFASTDAASAALHAVQQLNVEATRDDARIRIAFQPTIMDLARPRALVSAQYLHDLDGGALGRPHMYAGVASLSPFSPQSGSYDAHVPKELFVADAARTMLHLLASSATKPRQMYVEHQTTQRAWLTRQWGAWTWARRAAVGMYLGTAASFLAWTQEWVLGAVVFPTCVAAYTMLHQGLAFLLATPEPPQLRVLLCLAAWALALPLAWTQHTTLFMLRHGHTRTPPAVAHRLDPVLNVVRPQPVRHTQRCRHAGVGLCITLILGLYGAVGAWLYGASFTFTSSSSYMTLQVCLLVHVIVSGCAWWAPPTVAVALVIPWTACVPGIDPLWPAVHAYTLMGMHTCLWLMTDAVWMPLRAAWATRHKARLVTAPPASATTNPVTTTSSNRDTGTANGYNADPSPYSPYQDERLSRLRPVTRTDRWLAWLGTLAVLLPYAPAGVLAAACVVGYVRPRLEARAALRWTQRCMDDAMRTRTTDVRTLAYGAVAWYWLQAAVLDGVWGALWMQSCIMLVTLLLHVSRNTLLWDVRLAQLRVTRLQNLLSSTASIGNISNTSSTSSTNQRTNDA